MKMLLANKNFIFQIVCFLALANLASAHHYKFVVREAPYTRLCNTKNILTVNGEFPGPTIKAYKGETIWVKVYNEGRYNITIHWHGVKQPRNSWSDGPEYITQCPIKPGDHFSYMVILSSEEGTVWWHAHSNWGRATVHGLIVVYPKPGMNYPYKFDEEVPILLGEWWIPDVHEVFENFTRSGAAPRESDALTINGMPGVLYPCSKSDTFKLVVDQGKTYLLRMVNVAMNVILFFSIAKHNLTVVATDGSYSKPYTREYLAIAPGQSFDVLLEANQNPSCRYYMAARVYNPFTIPFDNTTTTAILQYKTIHYAHNRPLFPHLPYYNDTFSAYNFFNGLKSLATKEHPIDVPHKIGIRLKSTIAINLLPCGSCEGPNGSRVAASMNNISFVHPRIDILEAYYYHIIGVFGKNFPSRPPYEFNFTEENPPPSLSFANRRTKVKVIDYNSKVEFVFQNTRVGVALDHPMHLHGYSFYVVGSGNGNFDEHKDPLRYNLIDPPLHNTVSVPLGGWTAIRFHAHNPGVWFMHCHFERHLTWGMETVLIVKNGKYPSTWLLPPPKMPQC